MIMGSYYIMMIRVIKLYNHDNNNGKFRPDNDMWCIQ